MRRTTRIGRLGMLAGGLGIGAVLASTSGTASADPSTDPLSWIDQLLGGLSVPASATASPLDMQISINGTDLFSTVGNTATATSGAGSIAIAIGDGADANASGGPGGSELGILDFAFADGTDSSSDVGLGADLDSAIAYGTGSQANVGLGSSLDNATALGTNSFAQVGIGGNLDTAFADGTGDYSLAGIGNDDHAIAIDTGSSATAGAGYHDLAVASGGGDAISGLLHSTAFADGTNSDAEASGAETTAIATGGNAEAQANYISDIAAIFNTGSAFDEATAAGGVHDVAEIIGTGSTAVAGLGGDWNLAAVFGDMLDANATGGNFLVDILPSL